MNEEVFMLSTLDNPFNPFTEFSKWKKFDEDNNYFSCSLLDRLSFTSETLSDEQNQKILNIAITDIVDDDETAKYIRVRPETVIKVTL